MRKSREDNETTPTKTDTKYLAIMVFINAFSNRLKNNELMQGSENEKT